VSEVPTNFRKTRRQIFGDTTKRHSSDKFVAKNSWRRQIADTLVYILVIFLKLLTGTISVVYLSCVKYALSLPLT
jgi:hypothetical protein